MSENLDDGSPAACADALVDAARQVRAAGARRLALAVRWADLHPPAEQPTGLTGAANCRASSWSRPRRPGSDGTPAVAAGCVDELGVLLGVSTGAALRLLGDALDLRHRLPQVWGRVQALEVEDWVARRVARRCAEADLDAAQARWVDGEVVQALVGLTVGRALAVVEAKVAAADPDGHRLRVEAEEEDRHLTLGRRSPAGFQSLSARTTVGDAARLDAMVDRLADLLDPACPKRMRRAQALGVLADPARACLVLAEHAAEADPLSSAGDEPPDQLEPPSAAERAADLGRALRAWDAETGGRVLHRLRPRTVLYVHLAEEALAGVPGTGVLRAETARGHLSALDRDQLLDWLGVDRPGVDRLGGDRLEIRPVVDPSRATPVDAYEIPRTLREAISVLAPFECFPWGSAATRAGDLDHTVPWREGGPARQTRLDNLGGLSRGHHLLKTFAPGWVHEQPVPGTHLWRTPTGHWFSVDARGSKHHGRARPEVSSAAGLGRTDGVG